MKGSYILIFLLLLLLVIPVSSTVNWTYDDDDNMSVTVDLINESGFSWAYTVAMANKSNATDFPIVAFATDMASPWMTAFSDYGGLFIVIIWCVFLLMAYRNSGDIFIPSVMFAISASAVILLLPGVFDITWMLIILAGSVAAIIYRLFIQED